MRPDVILGCVETPEKHVTEPPALVAEVLSPGTADKDYNEKSRLYEEHAGDYYLIVDPDENTLISYMPNEHGRFVIVEPVNLLVASICGDCHITLDTTSMF